MKNIFIPSTEHHLTICLGIIIQKKIKNALIIYIEDIKSSENRLFFDEFSKLQERFSFKFFPLNFENKNRFFSSKFLSRMLGYRRRYAQIANIIGNVSVHSEFYVFADQNPYTQFVIDRYKECTFSLAHEGFWMYVDHSLKRNNFYKRLYYKILFGWFWKPVKTIGSRCTYKNFYVLYPNMIHSRYESAKVIEVKQENYLSEDLREISGILLQKIFPQFFALSEKDAFVFLPRIVTSRDLKKVRDDLVEIFRNVDCERVFIKNHPRSNSKLKFSDLITNRLDCIEIPNGIPAECLFVFNDEILVKYFLPFSTLLLVAALNSKPNQVFCVDYLMQKSLSESFDNNISLKLFIEKFKISSTENLS